MNNYQIYEEIGKGRHSTVYKGRRKKSIEYYAIASIDKDQRQRVLNSVHFLRRMTQKNVLKFHNWYETSNHLWVITEYCTGGDLRAVLQADGKLPEASVRIFGCDLLEGLMHIHSQGVAYGDVKPSNILMDACCSLRYYDFGLAEAFESANAGTKLGAPCYMAPELFFDDGVHSIASDIWALGCVLYEMGTGAPPFVDSNLQNLIQKIVNEPFVKVDSFTSSFNELLELMLQKDPLQRASWAEVLNNDFWQCKFELLTFPKQPAFEDYRRKQLEIRKRSNPTMEKERRKEEVLRASVNAEKNLSREMKEKEGYQESAANIGVGVDREVNFRDPTEEVEEKPGSAEPGEHSPSLDVHKSVENDNGTGTTRGVEVNVPVTVLSVESVLSHTSDNHVKPIIMNSRIERFTEAKFNASELPFQMYKVEQIKAMPTAELEGFLSQIYRALNNNQSSSADRINILSCVESLCGDTQLANIFISTSVFDVCIKMLSNGSMGAVIRALLATIVGLVFRHAAVIDAKIQSTSVFPILVHAFGDASSKVRRRVIACQGELLFYIATQPPMVREQWTIPDEVVGVFFNALTDNDEVTVHYAVKTIENVSTSDSNFAMRFATKDFVASLLLVHLATQIKSEHLKSSALCAALRLCMLDPLLIHVVVAKLPPVSYGGILGSTHSKSIQALLSFINQFLSKAVSFLLQTAGNEQHLVHCMVWTTKQTHSIFSTSVLSSQMVRETINQMLQNRDKFMSGLATCLEHSAAAIRGKSCLTILLLTVVEPSFLSNTGDFKLFPYLEKMYREKDSYVLQCISLLHQLLQRFISTTLSTIALPDGSQVPSVASDLSVVLQVLSFNSLQSEVLKSEEVFVHVGKCVQLVPNYDGDTQKVIFQIVEALLQDPGRVVQYHLPLLNNVLPPFLTHLASPNVSVRFTAIKTIHDMIGIMMMDWSLFNPAQPSHVVGLIHHIVFQVLPFTDALLRDADQIPLYTMKLLAVCCDKSTEVLGQVSKSATVNHLLVFLDVENPNYCIYVLKLLLRIIQAGGESITINAMKQQTVSKLTKVLENSLKDGMNDYVDITLEIIFFILCGAVKSQSQLLISECQVWGSSIDTLFLPLCKLRNSVAECAASCVQFLSQLYSQAQGILFSTQSLDLVREALEKQDQTAFHVAGPLLRALIVGATRLSEDAVAKFQQNELFLIQLQSIASQEAEEGSEVESLAQQLLGIIYSRPLSK